MNLKCFLFHKWQEEWKNKDCTFPHPDGEINIKSMSWLFRTCKKCGRVEYWVLTRHGHWKEDTKDFMNREKVRFKIIDSISMMR